MRKNASSDALFKYFVTEWEAKTGRIYKPSVWDKHSLKTLKEFYGSEVIAQVIDYYMKVNPGGGIQDFANKFDRLAEALEQDQLSVSHYNKLKQETFERMKEAGKIEN